jgi:uncharacterized protein YndB with AHSA1/START domain
VHDLIAALRQAGRTVAEAELRDAPAHVVELRRTLRAPVADVWEACTRPEHVRRWFLPSAATCDPAGPISWRATPAAPSPPASPHAGCS